MLQVAQVRRIDRVGLMMGKRAIELEVQRHRLQRQPVNTSGTV